MKLNRLAGEFATIPTQYADLEVTGLTANSQDVQPGYAFVAIAGSVRDGAEYIGDAKAKGAALIVASDKSDFLDPGMPVLRVSEPRRFLARAAAHMSGLQPAHMVAVTGTAGKTSVAIYEIIRVGAGDFFAFVDENDHIVGLVFQDAAVHLTFDFA